MPTVDPTRCRLLVNPAAGAGRAGARLAELGRLAGDAGIEIAPTESLEELEREARRARDDRLERLLVAGGDGTLHHALQPLAGSSTTLGLLPLGSGNDFAACLDLPRDLERAFTVALHGPTRTIDLGRVGLEGDADTRRWYAGVAGVGFDGEVADRVNRGGRRVGNPLVYVWGVVRGLGSFQPPRVELEIGDDDPPHGEPRHLDTPVMLVAFANTHRFGGGMRIAPGARPDDGLLEIVLVHRVAKLELLRIFPRVYRGGHTGHPAVETFAAPRLRLRLDRPIPVYGDGELMIQVPEGTWLTAEVVPDALTVAVPVPSP